jgi:hypothetical protein
VKRREFVTLIGATMATWPLKAWALRASGLPRVGLLAFAQELEGPLFRAFRGELQKLGQAEGQNYTLEFRSAHGEPGRLQRDAAEFAQMPVDVIVTDGGAASIAAKKATATVPIVMAVISDPFELGLVASLVGNLIVERANANRSRAVYPEREFAEAGGLLAYGPNISENFRGRVVCCTHSKRRKSCRISSPATCEIRAGDQSQDRQSARPAITGHAARPR